MPVVRAQLGQSDLVLAQVLTEGSSKSGDFRKEDLVDHLVKVFLPRLVLEADFFMSVFFRPGQASKAREARPNTLKRHGQCTVFSSVNVTSREK
mmetsp:Transcript_60763/g.142288  ORF Transcript_60763/g.142288 Transcript_60763/m.142288 type:complete len:94 (-) Transcript_60763:10-291(-)